ncbi:hypothetical protein DL93DRAFT_301727 [Clavulina sp. PMI_390]|nr:hypothetical protein DL93DRAFT_301727 [Clavulina sp. PMI_390]
MAPGIKPFCSDVRKTAEQLENLGDTGLSNLNLQPISPHTRVQRASAISSSLSHSEQSLELLRQLLKKTQSLHDSLRLEYAVSANSVCPALQLPDEILRMVFLFYIEDEDNDSRPTWLLEVCHRWRATALVCPQLWTTINPADSIPLLQRSFHPSSNLPLQIYVSRFPPPKYREFEKEQGLVEDSIQQIQQSSVSRLTITGQALRQGIALFDAFGRDSALAMLPTKAVYFAGGHPAFFENRVDMRNVEFPNIEVFELHRCSLPLLDHSQLFCSHLSVGGLNTTPHSFATFLEGFSYIKSLEIHYFSVSDRSHGDDWRQIHLPSLKSLAILDSAANDTVNTLDLLDTDGISTLKLDHALAYDVWDDSPSALMVHSYALAGHFKQPVSFK